MALKEDQIESIIIRFLQGHSNEEEVAELMAWIDSSDNNLKTFRQIQDLWNSIEVDRNITLNSIDHKWSVIESKINPFKVKTARPSNHTFIKIPEKIVGGDSECFQSVINNMFNRSLIQ